MTEGRHAHSDQDAIWDYYQTEAIGSFDGARSRLSYLARQFKPGQSILNIGIGSGYLEAEAQRRGVVVSTLDPSTDAVAALRDRLELGDRAQVGYSQNMPFVDSTFDAVVASEVLEHLSDDILRGTLLEIGRVLKPGGVFWGTVPARERLSDQVVVCPCCGQWFHRWGHHQSFTTERMRTVLTEHFQVDRVFETYFAPWNTLNWKGSVLCLLKLLLLQVGVHGSEEKIVFQVRKPG
jgi:SAM-dependent methyltransferase